MKHLTFNNLGWVLTLIVCFLLEISAILKFGEFDISSEYFNSLIVTPYWNIIGSLEILGSVLLLHVKTSKYGALIILCLMSGLVITQLSIQSGLGIMLPISIGAASWASHCLRRNKPKRRDLMI